MSYSYLLDLYRTLDQRTSKLAGGQADTDIALAEDAFLRGRLDCLIEFRSFLQEHYQHKLPRRVRSMLEK